MKWLCHFLAMTEGEGIILCKSAVAYFA
jgi:hypothetical protein